MNLTYINKIAPDHAKTSCSDKDFNNAACYWRDAFDGCIRCTLLRAAQPGPEEFEDDESDN